MNQFILWLVGVLLVFAKGWQLYKQGRSRGYYNI